MSTAPLTSDAYLFMLSRMPNEKAPRVILPMPRELLRAVDDFRFDNRVDSRAGGDPPAATAWPRRCSQGSAFAQTSGSEAGMSDAATELRLDRREF